MGETFLLKFKGKRKTAAENDRKEREIEKVCV